MLLKLCPPEGSDVPAVALRVFGDRTEDLIDRERELRILLQLNAAGFGATVSVLPPLCHECLCRHAGNGWMRDICGVWGGVLTRMKA